MKKYTILIFFLLVFGIFYTQTVFAPPEPDPESDFRYSDHVVIGKILSYEIFIDPKEDTSDKKYLDTIEYNVEVLEWFKNPLKENVITVYGTFYPNDVVPEPEWGIVAFDVGDTVYLYLDQTDNGLKFRSYGSALLSQLPNECERGESPSQGFVFFDCKWVEIPHGWTYEKGQWQEDPSILKLGPEPKPSCPTGSVCTCDGKYSYYNKTTQKCDSSPYMPEYYQKACGQYRKLAFEDWEFDSRDCDWNSLKDLDTSDKQKGTVTPHLQNENSSLIFNSKNGTGLIALKVGQEVDVIFTHEFRNDKIFDGYVYYNIAENGKLISQSQNFTISEIPKTFKFSYTPQKVGIFPFTKGSMSHSGVWGGEQGQSIIVLEKFSKAMKFNGQCKNPFPEFTLVIKHDFSTGACVKQESKTKLIERGWAIDTR